MKKLTALSFLVLFIYPVFSDDVSVAVMNFSNETGGEGLAYISSSLADSLSATLSQSEGISIVERRQLSLVLEEHKLELSGILDDESVSRAGALARTDVLITGSYTGNPEKITLTIKALRTETAEILYGRVIISSLASLFDVANQEIKVFISVITGRDTGRITITSEPSGAEIYIDGMAAGKAPLIEYLIPSGSRRIRAVLEGYKDEERNVSVESGKITNLNVKMIQTRSSYPWTISAGAAYKKPLNSPSNSDFEPSIEVPVSLDYSFDRLTVSGSWSFSKMDHSQDIDSVFGTIEQTRWYTFHTFAASLLYSYLDEMKYISPYAGVFLGGSIITDKKENASYDEGWEKLSRTAEFAAGLKTGATFFPEYKLRPFIEAALYIYPGEIIRKEYESPGMGGALQETEKAYRFFGFSIGGGLRYAFR